MKLFYKFVLIMVLLATVPLLVQGFMMLHINRAAFHSTVMETHTQLVRAISDDINDYIAGLNLDMAFVLNFERLPQMTWNEKMKVLLSVLSVHKNFALISLLDSKGRETTKAHNPVFRGASSVLMDRSGEAIFREAKADNAPHAGDIYYEYGVPLMNLVYPLSSAEQYVFVTVSFNQLWDKIGSLKIAKTGCAFLIDRDGKVIFRPDRDDGKSLRDISGIGFIKQVLSGEKENGKGEFLDMDDVPVIGAYHKIKSLGWTVITRQKQSEAYGSIMQMKANAVLWIFISIVIASLAAFLLARNMTRPIAGLMAGVESLMKGDFSHKVKVTTADEIGSLAKAFNFMGKKIEEFQDALVQKERLAAVGQMAAVVGHEIRNPLSAISNAVYYIKSRIGSSDEKIQKHLGIMEKEIHESDRIINDLLGFSRTQAPILRPSDINEVVENSLAVASIPDNVKLEKNLSRVLPSVPVNPDEIRQVFVNLMNNACQAMHEGGVLGVVTEMEESGRVRVSISDTGCGIPEERLPRVFEAFFTTKSRGTGLGLAVVKRIIDRHRGTIQVKSRVGSGTTFVICLPV